MSDQKSQEDHWKANDYQHSASFVPKLAGKVVQWLDLQPDDTLLDVGCGDGILNQEFSEILAQGSGSQHGIDSSGDMIRAAKELCKNRSNTSFEVLDATQLSSSPALQQGKYTKAFSNAALHWILKEPSTRQGVFDSVASSLQTGGTFALEMGGQGNIAEMRTALYTTLLSRSVHLSAITAADPWFFPDETWLAGALQQAGFEVLQIEREWRPTRADKGGVEGWVRLFGKQLLDVVGDAWQREEAARECGRVLREICRTGDGGWEIGYVRLRALARKK